MFAIIVHFITQKLKNKQTFIQTEKAKSSHFDRTRGDKKQIFPTQGPIFGLRSCQKVLDLRYIKFWVKTKLGCEFKKNRYLGSRIGFM